MVKKYLIYFFVLMIMDMFFTLGISLIQKAPGGGIIILIVAKLVCLTFLFILFGLLLYPILRKVNLQIGLVLVTVIVYLSFPIFNFLFKKDEYTIWQIYHDMHLNPKLFFPVTLPYIVAGITSFLICIKMKLFD